MYYMVTALSEFTKKIVVLAFKNMLTTWVSKDYHKGCWLWFHKWNIWLKLCPKLLLLTELKKELMNTVAMRKYQQKILKKFELFKAVFFFFYTIVLNVHMQYHVHIVTFFYLSVIKLCQNLCISHYVLWLKC